MHWLRSGVLAVMVGAGGCGDDGGSMTSADSGTATSDGFIGGTATVADDGFAEVDSGGSTGRCGDGVLDPGEQCDDGNDSDLDECTSSCRVSTCVDGIRSGGESDVDCGGPCRACEVCAGCEGDDDCLGGICDEGVCVEQWSVSVDWVTDCAVAPGASVVKIEDLPPGTYRALARPSAATVWAPPWNPPQTGFSYVVPCEGLGLGQMRTPPSTFYGSADQAFANLLALEEGFSWSGGALRCGLADQNCADNTGRIAFDVVSSCR